MAIVWNKSIKEFVVEVIRDANDKTCVWLEKKVKMHPKYKKRYYVIKKYYIHDESNEAKVGDTIKIRETKPMSRTKRRKMISIIKKAITA